MTALIACLITGAALCGAGADGWTAGVSKADITPAEPVWMAGYASRDRAAEGTLHPLWVKALALGDAEGRRALIITSDILGFPKVVADRIFERLEKSTGLDRAAIILNSSHTHSGPVIDGSLMCIYPLAAADREKIAQYTAVLEDKVAKAGEEALRAMVPVTLDAGNGVTRFAVNRRNNKEAEIASTHDLNGPVDHAVPVLRVTGADGALLAVLFGYACHNTTLCEQQWCGDYAGFAQLAVEAAHPGATALFFAGCGADQNPIPRRTVSLARQYGTELASAVETVLSEPMRGLAPSLKTAGVEVDLPLETPKDRAELEKIAGSDAGYLRRAAGEMLAELDAGRALPTSRVYPVRVWNLGGQPLVALAGEVVAGYAVLAKQMLGTDAFVMGYSNDLVGYIPTAVIAREGGYEGDASQMIYGLPAKWSESIEPAICAAVREAAEKAGIPFKN